MYINPISTALQGTHAARSAAAQSSSSSNPTTPDQAAASSEQAFLSLLVTELKAQDPTSPMDPTTMVGQMLSMNQLNELISINQTLQTAFGMSSASPVANSATSSPTGAH
ncbi:MAG TPA: flagellar hook capping FlgD N-terminal domain-containing protein [Terriglobales bacterium]|nr:flagellar hook capping FlgD N-terminal domain-containing protein [Terriglobales bacterium]